MIPKLPGGSKEGKASEQAGKREGVMSKLEEKVKMNTSLNYLQSKGQRSLTVNVEDGRPS